jgi:hypothetical protein
VPVSWSGAVERAVICHSTIPFLKPEKTTVSDLIKKQNKTKLN